MGGASVHPAGHSSNLTLCAYGCVEVILFLTVQKFQKREKCQVSQVRQA